MRTRYSRATLLELLKLRDMALTWHRFMEEPSKAERLSWHPRTASYVEELEGILNDLNCQAIEALYQAQNEGGSDERS